MKIVSEAEGDENTTRCLFGEDGDGPTSDMAVYGPFIKRMTEREEREATVTLFGSLLDGGYA